MARMTKGGGDGGRNAMTYNEQMQRYKDEYLRETGKEAVTTRELAEWAIRTRRWEPPKDLVLRKCREDFSKALRAEHITDSAGQPVRVNQAARERTDDGQMTFYWADIRTIKRPRMERAAAQRREQIVGECRQLDRDERYWSDHHPDEEPIATPFDMTDDVIEGRFSGDIDEPEDDQDDE